MSLPLAAVGAVVAALLELTLAPYLKVGSAQPDIVLVLAIIWTMVVGFEGGLVWAFLGGLMIDLLASRPLGSTSFVLLLCVGAAALVRRSLHRARYVSPIVTVLILALFSPLLFLVIYGMVRGPVGPADLVGTTVPRALYDTAIAAVLAPVAVLLQTRFGDQERVDW